MSQDFLRWQVGETRITRVVDEVNDAIGALILPMATPEAVREISWLRPDFVDEAGRLVLSIHSLVIETPGPKILVDTCLGSGKPREFEMWSMRNSAYLDDLEKAGHPVESIDVVLCTHLHIDHVGFNTTYRDGRWQPTFPNARYLIAEKEWNHWKDEPETFGPIIADSVRPLFDAGYVDLVQPDHQVCPEVSLESTPGHTPGHVSVRIESDGRHAAITGDMIHHPCQMARPEWSTVVDTDRELSRETRRGFLAGLAGEPTLVIGTHFAGPTAGHIIRDGEGFRLVSG